MARPKSEGTRELRRVQVDMPEKSFERLKKLVLVTEAGGYTEVVKNALRLYEALIDEVEAGHEIMIRTDKGTYPFKVFSS